MVKVVTLDEPALIQACSVLASRVADLPYNAIVGVATGGEVIARHMHASLPAVPIFTATAKRRGTKVKEQLPLDRFLRRLPMSVNHALRVGEHYLREVRFEYRGRPNLLRQVSLESRLAEWLEQQNEATLLIVDDAVDSGSTFQGVITAVRELNPRTRFYTAAITQTFRRPLVTPDVLLYKATLVRFPWSLDTI